LILEIPRPKEDSFGEIPVGLAMVLILPPTAFTWRIEVICGDPAAFGTSWSRTSSPSRRNSSARIQPPRPSPTCDASSM